MPKSKNIYELPLHVGTKIIRQVTDSPGHPGAYKTAIDFEVAVGTDVLSPLNGRVITVVDSNSKYGYTPEFASRCNYIQIQHDNGEITDLIHLAKGTALVKVGDIVKTGQLLAKTGLSGWMTAPHLHWFVYKRVGSKAGFTGLDINLDSATPV